MNDWTDVRDAKDFCYVVELLDGDEGAEVQGQPGSPADPPFNADAVTDRRKPGEGEMESGAL